MKEKIVTTPSQDDIHSEDNQNESLEIVITPVNNTEVKIIGYTEALKELLYCALPFTAARGINSAYWVTTGFILNKLGPDAFAAGPLILSISYATGGTMRAGLLVIAGLVGKLDAADQKGSIGPLIHRGFVLGLSYSIPCILVMVYSDNLLNAIGISEDVSTAVGEYFDGVVYALPGIVFMTVGMCFANGIKNSLTTMIAMFGCIIGTAAIGYPLALGWPGFLPKMGVYGLGLGMSIAVWLTDVGLYSYYFLSSQFKEYNLFNFDRKNLRLIFYSDVENQDKPVYLQNILHSIKLSLPMSAENLAEWGNLLGISIICGLISADCLQALQISMNLVSPYTMLYVGFTNTGYMLVSRHYATVRANFSHDAFMNVRTIGTVTTLLGIAAATTVGTFMVSMPRQICNLYFDVNDPNNEEVLILAQAFLITNGIGLLFDSLRISNADLLKGLEDVRYAPLLSLFFMSAVGLTVGGCMTLLLDWGADWLFITRDIGVLLAAIGIAYRWLKKSSTIELAAEHDFILPNQDLTQTLCPTFGGEERNCFTFFYHDEEEIQPLNVVAINNSDYRADIG
jgi:MATE family multidrug resistance protein